MILHQSTFLLKCVNSASNNSSVSNKNRNIQKKLRWRERKDEKICGIVEKVEESED